MNVDWIRAHCMALPHAAEKVQWGDDLVFKVAEKMFAVAAMVPSKAVLSFKSTPEEFAELVERPGVIPAPYMARAHWVALETEDAIPRAELKRLLTQSYQLVVAKPKKTQAALAGSSPKPARKNAPRRVD
jgi:predicted DNA-binding protein (MmcQ/YjbR family)